MSANLKKLYIIIPAYNEAENLPIVLADLKLLMLPGYAIHLVVVNDGSIDRTELVAQNFGVVVLSHRENLGIGAAIRTGTLYALANGADVILQVDGDGQHIPSEIKKLLTQMQQREISVVVGSRYLEKGNWKDSTTFLRWLASRFFAVLVLILTGSYYTDPTSGFRAYTREAAKRLVENYSKDYPEVDSLVLFKMLSLSIEEVAIKMKSRRFGKSSISGLKPVHYFFKVSLFCIARRLRFS